MDRVANQQESAELAARAHAAILADALSNGRGLYSDGNAYARDVVTKAIVDLKRAAGVAPEVMIGALMDASWTCQDADQKRVYEDEARVIAAREGSAKVRRMVFELTR